MGDIAANGFTVKHVPGVLIPEDAVWGVYKFKCMMLKT